MGARDWDCSSRETSAGEQRPALELRRAADLHLAPLTEALRTVPHLTACRRRALSSARQIHGRGPHGVIRGARQGLRVHRPLRAHQPDERARPRRADGPQLGGRGQHEAVEPPEPQQLGQRQPRGEAARGRRAAAGARCGAASGAVQAGSRGPGAAAPAVRPCPDAAGGPLSRLQRWSGAASTRVRTTRIPGPPPSGARRTTTRCAARWRRTTACSARRGFGSAPTATISSFVPSPGAREHTEGGAAPRLSRRSCPRSAPRAGDVDDAQAVPLHGRRLPARRGALGRCPAEPGQVRRHYTRRKHGANMAAAPNLPFALLPVDALPRSRRLAPA